ILASDADQRRRDFRILGDRQAQERHRAENRDDHRDDGGENRPVDEEMRNAHLGHQFRAQSALVLAPLLLASLAGAGARGCSSSGVTLPPGRARIRPLTITRSLAASPSLITRRPPSSCAGVTYFSCTVFLSSTTSTNLRDCSVPIAASGTSKVVCGGEPGT